MGYEREEAAARFLKFLEAEEAVTENPATDLPEDPALDPNVNCKLCVETVSLLRTMILKLPTTKPISSNAIDYARFFLAFSLGTMRASGVVEARPELVDHALQWLQEETPERVVGLWK